MLGRVRLKLRQWKVRHEWWAHDSFCAYCACFPESPVGRATRAARDADYARVGLPPVTREPHVIFPI